MKKLISILLTVVVGTSIVEYPTSARNETEIFYDDFSGGTLDPDKWLVAYKNWGGNITENGVKVDYNGGVIPQNVSVSDGRLILTGNGNMYNGVLRGINKDGSQRTDGKRTEDDINADGEFNVADAVILQKWLLNVSDSAPDDWNAGNLFDDDRLDIFDLVIMKQKFVNFKTAK